MDDREIARLVAVERAARALLAVSGPIRRSQLAAALSTPAPPVPAPVDPVMSTVEETV